jgi:hypothetical protein
MPRRAFLWPTPEPPFFLAIHKTLQAAWNKSNTLPVLPVSKLLHHEAQDFQEVCHE